jgi:hypothetical protein
VSKLNIEFIFDAKESNYSKLECYRIYDFATNELVQDVKLNKSVVRIDRKNKLIYFMNMNCETHWILEKQYFYKIIQEFMKQVEDFNCKDYTICQDTSGGEIYYKYR